MRHDKYIRVILTIIALCLIVLVYAAQRIWWTVDESAGYLFNLNNEALQRTDAAEDALISCLKNAPSKLAADNCREPSSLMEVIVYDPFQNGAIK